MLASDLQAGFGISQRDKQHSLVLKRTGIFGKEVYCVPGKIKVNTGLLYGVIEGGGCQINILEDLLNFLNQTQHKCYIEFNVLIAFCIRVINGRAALDLIRSSRGGEMTKEELVSKMVV